MIDVTFECPCCETFIDVTLMKADDRVEYNCHGCNRRAYYSENNPWTMRRTGYGNVQPGIKGVKGNVLT